MIVWFKQFENTFLKDKKKWENEFIVILFFLHWQMNDKNIYLSNYLK